MLLVIFITNKNSLESVVSHRRCVVPPTLRRYGPSPLLGGVALGVAMALSSSVVSAEPAGETTLAQRQVVAFDIAAQPLDRAALAFAEQAGVQVFFDSARLQGFASTALKGRYSLDEGLRRLLGTAPVDYCQ